MNCKDIVIVLPELVSGELDKARVRKAMEHIGTCRRCADEHARYEEALTALSQPRKMIEVPPALGALRPPEKRDRALLRPGLVAAVLAVALAIVIVLPKLHRESPVVRKPGIIEHPMATPRVATRQAPAVSKEPPKSQAIAKKSERQPVRSIKPSIGKRHVVRRQIELKQPPTVRAEQQTNIPKAPEEQPKPIIIIASCVESPPVIEVESINHATGIISAYSATQDEAGHERVIEVVSSLDIQNDRRVQL